MSKVLCSIPIPSLGINVLQGLPQIIEYCKLKDKYKGYVKDPMPYMRVYEISQGDNIFVFDYNKVIGLDVSFIYKSIINDEILEVKDFSFDTLDKLNIVIGKPKGFDKASFIYKYFD